MNVSQSRQAVGHPHPSLSDDRLHDLLLLSSSNLLLRELNMSGYTSIWKRLSSRQLAVAIQIFSLLAIFFEGYDQGVSLQMLNMLHA